MTTPRNTPKDSKKDFEKKVSPLTLTETDDLAQPAPPEGKTQSKSLNKSLDKSLDQTQAVERAEAEYAKDVWDTQFIPGVKRLVNKSPKKINFLGIPEVFRPAIKHYARYMLGKNAESHVINVLSYIKHFVQFYHARYPEATDLTAMTRGDMEAFLVVVRSYRTSLGKPASDHWKYFVVMYLDNWLLHLDRIADPFAPKTSRHRLVWPEDRGDHIRGLYRNSAGTRMKYIPEFVLAQVDAHLHEFMPLYYRPVVLLMRASGWRISDILNLRLDTCLKQTGKRWWLQGDIPKTGVQAHRVPITEDVVRVVQAQIAMVETHYTPIINPLGLLFPSVSFDRIGQGLRSDGVSRALKKFIQAHNICDEQGKLYHFTPHAFRHTKAVELINNGMPLMMVSEWLAHASLEMTTVYAKVLDTTMRDKWEEVMQKGALRIQENGPPIMFDPLASGDKDEIEWEYIRHNLDTVRLQNGYCFRSDKYKDCPVQAIPCHTCVNFCTTPDFLPQFEAQRQGVLIQIELGHSRNQPRTIERNTQILAPIEEIIDTLKTGALHHGMNRAQREYTAEEIAQGKHLPNKHSSKKED